MDFASRSRRAAETLRRATFARIISARTVASVAASAVLARTMERAGAAFHISYVDGDQGDLRETGETAGADLLVSVGLTEAAARSLKHREGETLVLSGDSLTDPEAKDVVLTGAQDEGPWEASVAGVSMQVSLECSDANADLLPIACVGIICDAGTLSRLPGLDSALLAESEKRSFIEAGPPVHFQGHLIESLSTSTRPFLPQVSGRAQNAKKLLERLKISSAFEWSMLPAGDRRRLSDSVALRLLAATGRASSAETVSAASLVAKDLGELWALTLSARSFARTAYGHMGAHLLGAKIPPAELRSAWVEENDELMRLGLRLEREGLTEMNAISHFQATGPGDAHSAGVLACDSFSTKGVVVVSRAHGEETQLHVVPSSEALRARFDAFATLRSCVPPGSRVRGNRRMAIGVVPFAVQASVLQSIDKAVEGVLS
ncbi:MAG: hypothetical protein HY556_01175 [Euryarchaeota archaeon]|nr:hypothetical protein [Euryarchaeota archaeon]